MSVQTPRDDEDDRLVRLTLSGASEAFRDLVKKYEKGVYYFCLSQTKRPEEAEDAAQEVFLRAFVSLKTFSLDKRFKTWLYTIAANHLRSRSRKALFTADKLRRAFFSGAGRPAGDPEGAARRNIESVIIRDAVLELPEKLCSPVYLYYLEDFSVGEICQALGLGVEAVKSRLFRGRHILREKLEELNP